MFFERHGGGERAILVHLDGQDPEAREDPQEFQELANSAGAETVAFFNVPRHRPTAKFLIGSGKVEELRDLVKAEEADLVLGSRYVPGGGVKNWGFWRRFLSRGGSLYARVLLGLPYQDLTGGFKCFRREVLETLDLGAVRSNGYSFQIELTYRAHCKGFKIKEVPIVFEDREVGKSKMSKHIFWEAVLMVWKLRMEGL